MLTHRETRKKKYPHIEIIYVNDQKHGNNNDYYAHLNTFEREKKKDRDIFAILPH